MTNDALLGNAIKLSRLRGRIDLVISWAGFIGGTFFLIYCIIGTFVDPRRYTPGIFAAGLVAAVCGWLVFHRGPDGAIALGVVLLAEMTTAWHVFPGISAMPFAVQVTVGGISLAFVDMRRWRSFGYASVALIMTLGFIDVGRGVSDWSLFLYLVPTAAAVFVLVSLPGSLVYAAELDTSRVSGMVEASPVPMIVVDYRWAITAMESYRVPPESLHDFLLSHPRALQHVLDAVRPRIANTPWRDLVGWGAAASSPAPVDFIRPAGEPQLPFIEAMVDQLVAVATSQVARVAEHPIPTRQRGTIWVLSSWRAPIVNGRPDYSRVVIAAFDIERLKEAERVLADQVQSQDRFLATVSHELRTPLTAILGLALELRDRGDEFGDGERAKLLDIIVEQAEDVASIVEDILVATRLDSGELPISLRPFDIASEIVGAGIGKLGEVEYRTSARPLGDPQRVRQILRNLISNANRHGGAVTSLVVDTDSGNVRLAVKDSGPPIPTTVQTVMFDPYVRGDRTPGLTQSVGLGLYISRKLAELMGGRLEYHHDGVWSSFTLVLPMAAQDRTQPAA